MKFIHVEFGPANPLSAEDKLKLDESLAENRRDMPEMQIHLDYFDMLMAELPELSLPPKL